MLIPEFKIPAIKLFFCSFMLKLFFFMFILFKHLSEECRLEYKINFLKFASYCTLSSGDANFILILLQIFLFHCTNMVAPLRVFVNESYDFQCKSRTQLIRMSLFSGRKKNSITKCVRTYICYRRINLNFASLIVCHHFIDFFLQTFSFLFFFKESLYFMISFAND